MSFNLIEWFKQILDNIALVLAQLGVPEAYRGLGALAMVYLLAILVVVLLILVLFRLARKKAAPPPGRAEGEAETLPAQGMDEVPEGEEQAPIAEPPPAGGKEAPAVGAEAAEPERREPVVEEPPVSAPEVRPAEPVTPEVAAPPLPERPVAPKLSLFERMRQGLAKTQTSLVGRIDSLLKGSKVIDADLLEELEEILITADLGMKTTRQLVEALEERLGRNELQDMDALRRALQDELTQRMKLEVAALDIASASPFVIMVVGVNGVGKTTTIGKLTRQFKAQGKKVVLGAGDTFRAAAAEQLSIWGERSGVEVIRHKEGADPAAVAFDAARAAIARKADLLILDTAGRLHTKVNLMEELKKIRRVLNREIPGAPHETLLVLDATTGQNALSQAKIFSDAVEVTGIALTKLDGTAKGGIVVAIGNELGLPVRYVGIGEGVEDLRPFDPELFAAALFKND